jgi:hypothetical protein
VRCRYEDHQPGELPYGHWHLAASFTLYIGVGTFQQLLHSGSGRGNRRMGKTRRMLFRLAGLACLGCAHVPLAYVLPATEIQAKLTVLVDLGWLTALAFVELCASSRHARSHTRGTSDELPFRLPAPSPRSHPPKRPRLSVGQCSTVSSQVRPSLCAVEPPRQHHGHHKLSHRLAHRGAAALACSERAGERDEAWLRRSERAGERGEAWLRRSARAAEALGAPRRKWCRWRLRGEEVRDAGPAM